MSLIDMMQGERRDIPLLAFAFAGTPIGKGRPRARIVQPRGGAPFISFYTPKETEVYEEALRWTALTAFRRAGHHHPLDGPLELIVWAYLPIPESWSNKKKDQAISGELRPIVKPDDDNIGKIIRDSLRCKTQRNARTKQRDDVPGVFVDDTQIVDGRTIKLYARETPGIVVEIRRAGAAPERWRPRLSP